MNGMPIPKWLFFVIAGAFVAALVVTLVLKIKGVI